MGSETMLGAQDRAFVPMCSEWVEREVFVELREMREISLYVCLPDCLPHMGMVRCYPGKSV